MGNSESGSKLQKTQVNQEHYKIRDHRDEDQNEQDRGEQSSESLNELFPFIKTETNNLIYIITTKYSLLDVLVSNGGLTYEQVSHTYQRERLTHRSSEATVRRDHDGNTFRRKTGSVPEYPRSNTTETCVYLYTRKGRACS